MLADISANSSNPVNQVLFILVTEYLLLVAEKDCPVTSTSRHRLQTVILEQSCAVWYSTVLYFCFCLVLTRLECFSYSCMYISKSILLIPMLEMQSCFLLDEK